MPTDPLSQFKAAQKEAWALFAPLEAITIAPAAHLVSFAGVKDKQNVLDVGCGTGVVAVTAARRGARVTGLDLSPVLLERAKYNAETAGVEIQFLEGDVEALPFPDSSFDLVLSQFGHMFAPRPPVAIKEMLRVLKPGGTIAFSTWPPELFTGRMFDLVGRYLPPPPGVSAPTQWGDPSIVRERLGEEVTDVRFDRDALFSPMLSPQHYRMNFEKTAPPVAKLMEALKDQPKKLAEFRAELEALAVSFSQGNTVRQQFLMTRATKK